ncbi:MAG: glycosyltransferase family 4 protein [Anaerolineae bacterium]
MTDKGVRIGFVSTRFNGTDGVSLEVVKWVAILTQQGHECFFFAGDSEWPSERSYTVAEAHFNHPDILSLNNDLFDDYLRSVETSQRVQTVKEHLKMHLRKFVNQFQLDILIAENALSLPMNVPLGLALTEYIAETGIRVIAHHHDFSWERSRFDVNSAADYLRAAFPPVLPSVRHVVINSFAARQLAMRCGARAVLVPNVMDFDTSPPPADAYRAGLRAELGISPDDLLLLQPTRVIPRKRIERAIELAQRLDMPNTLVVSHAAGDEGSEYLGYLQKFADRLGVRIKFADNRFSRERTQTEAGLPVYSLADAYGEADLVTYPSAVEGFGNAFLEAIYYRRPIIMCNYEIFNVDIKPKGFKVIIFDDFITEATVQETCDLLQNPERVAEMVETNYQIACRYYSYHTLEKNLDVLMSESLGI